MLLDDMSRGRCFRCVAWAGSLISVTTAERNAALLYQGQGRDRWRTSVYMNGDIACGALPRTQSGSFAEASQEFEEYLRQYWGVTGTLVWTETKPGWWEADLGPRTDVR